MALHLTPEDHDADPPSAWTVEGAGRAWRLKSSKGYTLDTFQTKRAALEAKTTGTAARQYEKEGRWFAGEHIENWKPYAAIVAEREARAARQAQLQEAADPDTGCQHHGRVTRCFGRWNNCLPYMTQEAAR